MKITFKAQHPHNKFVTEDDRGRTYLLGEMTAQVLLNDEGLTLLLTKESLIQKIKKILKEELECQ
jgi:hypothetical protein